MTLSPENRALVRSAGNLRASQIANSDPIPLNLLLDAARAEGYETGRVRGYGQGRAAGERSGCEFPRSESWT